VEQEKLIWATSPKTRGIAAPGYARPTASDNFIYGLKSVELRQNLKIFFKIAFDIVF